MLHNPKKSDFDIPYLKDKIKNTQPDEICILSGGYANYFTLPEDTVDWLEEELGQYVYINDYQDLCCDPHGIEP